MVITITCSCCGAHREISNEKMEYTVKAIKDGWGSFGSALYCPKCTAAWDERNPDRPMPGEKNTFWVIAKQFFEVSK